MINFTAQQNDCTPTTEPNHCHISIEELTELEIVGKKFHFFSLAVPASHASGIFPEVFGGVCLSVSEVVAGAPPQAIRAFLAHLEGLQENSRHTLPDYVWIDDFQHSLHLAITPVPWLEVVSFWHKLALAQNDWAMQVWPSRLEEIEGAFSLPGEEESHVVPQLPLWRQWHPNSDGGMLCRRQP